MHPGRSTRIGVAAALALAAALVACDRDSDFRHEAFYEDLQEDALGFTFVAGDWKEDFGDAAFYGTAFYAWVGVDESDPIYLDIAQEAYGRCMAMLDPADFISGDLNEMAMCALGAIEYMVALDDRGDLDALDEMIDGLDTLVQLMGWYLDLATIAPYAVETYGPTSISGLMGLINLQYAYVLGGERADDRLAWAREMAENIDDRAWNGTYYIFSDTRPGLFLYPNITMIIYNARLYQLTGETAFRERALAAYDAIQELKIEGDVAGSVRYRSPYSAEYMGATTDNYSTLSSQNYVMFALMLLYQITDDVAFLDETDAVLDFVEARLRGEWCLSHLHSSDGCGDRCAAGEVCVDGVCFADACGGAVLHHWMDERLALPEDPEFFCSGCNHQLLYLMWYRHEYLGEPDDDD